MAWTTPRTWAPGETVTAALMNAQLRDNLNLLKTRVDAAGLLRTRVAGTNETFANINAGETDGYSFSCPAGFLASVGDCLEVSATFGTAANGSTKTLKIYFGANSVTLYTGAGSGISGALIFNIVYVTSAAVRIQGALISATAGVSAIVINDIVCTPANANTVKFTLQGAASNDITMYSPTFGASRI